MSDWKLTLRAGCVVNEAQATPVSYLKWRSLVLNMSRDVPMSSVQHAAARAERNKEYLQRKGLSTSFRETYCSGGHNSRINAARWMINPTDSSNVPSQSSRFLSCRILDL